MFIIGETWSGNSLFLNVPLGRTSAVGNQKQHQFSVIFVWQKNVNIVIIMTISNCSNFYLQAWGLSALANSSQQTKLLKLILKMRKSFQSIQKVQLYNFTIYSMLCADMFKHIKSNCPNRKNPVLSQNMFTCSSCVF